MPRRRSAGNQRAPAVHRRTARDGFGTKLIMRRATTDFPSALARGSNLGYGFGVATSTMPFDYAEKRASDSLQAAYFRGALADQRALVAAEIARQTRTLNGLSTRSDALAISALRRDIHANEVECRDLDRMIAALDRRFA